QEWVVLAVLLSCIVFLPLAIYAAYKYTRKPQPGLRIGSLESGENKLFQISVISSDFVVRPDEPPKRRTSAVYLIFYYIINLRKKSFSNSRFSASFLHEQEIMDPGPLPKDLEVELEKIEAEKKKKGL
ncbi:hypothetical protein PFISCL1PPCAC_22843, partial [Pristionchus fissidentatus]